MLAVAAVALPLGLIPPAIEVFRTDEPHLHLWVNPDAKSIPGENPPRYLGRRPLEETHFAMTPFWPRYGRALVGLPWREQPVCGAGAGHLLETCEFARPEMRRGHESKRLLVGRPYNGWTTPKELWDEVLHRYPEEHAASKQRLAAWSKIKDAR